MASCVPDSCEICGTKENPAIFKVLPCFHILCKTCIDGLRVKNPKIPDINCPVDGCRKPFKPEALRSADPVKYLRELCELKDKVKTGKVFCDPCLQSVNKDTKASYSICNECGFLCSKCNGAHNTKNWRYSDHDVVLLGELSKSQEDTVFQQELKRRRAATEVCRKSGSRPLSENYDFEFGANFRPKSSSFAGKAVEPQNNYSLRIIQEEAEKKKKEIKQRLPQVCQARESLRGIVDEVDKETKKVKDQQAMLSQLIDVKCDQLRRTISKTQKELHNALDYQTNSKLTNLQQQQAILQGMIREFQRLVNYTESTLNTSTATELLASSKFLQDSIETATKEASKVPDEPVELHNLCIKDSLTPNMHKICQKRLKVFTKQADPSKCTAEGPGLSDTEARETAHFMVNIKDKDNKPCSSSQNVTVKVTCIQNEYSFYGEANEVTPGKCEVLFRPEFHGNHSIYVYVNEVDIAGSPYSVVVRKSTAQLGESLETIPEIKGPRAIALTEDGGLLVCEMNEGKVIKLDKHRRKTVTFRSDILPRPAGIALDSSENIYVVDLSEGSLVKFNSSGDVLNAVRKKDDPTGFNNARGVVVNNKIKLVYVCDHDNYRIQIFNSSDLQYMHTIDLRIETVTKPSKPNGIAFDDEGYMYVTDYANRCVLVFNSNEEYIKNYSISNVVQEGPDSIAIDETGLLYITVSRANCVLVFRKTGEFVKCFGHEGKHEGELKLPLGIAVNADGTAMYVCEFLNNRVQVFF